MKKQLLFFLIAMVIPFAKASAASAPKSDSPEAEKLHAIMTEYTEAVKKEDAFNAPYFNVEEDLSKFGDYLSDEYFVRAKKDVQTAIAKLKTVRAEKLRGNDLLAYRLFKGDLDVGLRRFDFPIELLEFNQMNSRVRAYIDSAIPALTSFPLDTVKHYEDFVKRSQGFPAYVDRQIATFQRGVKSKITLSCLIVEKTLNSYHDGMEDDVEKNPFFSPIAAMPASFSKEDKDRLTAEFKVMIRKDILPSMHKLDRYLRMEYRPHCRSEYGIGSLPNGKAWYNYSREAFAETKLSAATIHQLGLAEVKRIETEMAKVQKELGVKGTRAEFLKSLLTEPRYFYTSSQDMFNAFMTVKAAVAKQLPKYFSLMPKTDFEIVETANPEDAAGKYDDPTDYRPVGRFIVNTKHLRSVPKYEVTTLLMHETAPGHHLQLALAYELKNELTEYQRKVFSSSAFAEGWALYSEYLGREMGMYKDPLQKAGTLNDELLRAVRLVVDTGIHAMGWSHDQTIAYMKDHLASDDADIEIEANRYSVWPGQALAYKIGQLKIIELRKFAEKQLGPKFDIREFHRVVIGTGSLSLPVLEAQVRNWVDATSRTPIPAHAKNTAEPNAG